jgi:hypothetical protein
MRRREQNSADDVARATFELGMAVDDTHIIFLFGIFLMALLAVAVGRW